MVLYATENSFQVIINVNTLYFWDLPRLATLVTTFMFIKLHSSYDTPLHDTESWIVCWML